MYVIPAILYVGLLLEECVWIQGEMQQVGGAHIIFRDREQPVSRISDGP